jgi:hypothetical protein
MFWIWSKVSGAIMEVEWRESGFGRDNGRKKVRPAQAVILNPAGGPDPPGCQHGRLRPPQAEAKLPEPETSPYTTLHRGHPLFFNSRFTPQRLSSLFRADGIIALRVIVPERCRLLPTP